MSLGFFNKPGETFGDKSGDIFGDIVYGKDAEEKDVEIQTSL